MVINNIMGQERRNKELESRIMCPTVKIGNDGSFSFTPTFLNKNMKTTYISQFDCMQHM